jgi:hypothetical protein
MKELTMNLRIDVDDGMENSMAREDRNVRFEMPTRLSWPVLALGLSGPCTIRLDARQQKSFCQ